MAKSLRSGIRKSHRTVLRNRVHKPVEDARTQRLHEKLLEVANSAKPAHNKSTDDMDVTKTDDAADDDAAANEKKDANRTGGFFLTAQVPSYFQHQHSPPMSEQEAEEENLRLQQFLMYLGISSSIVGFDPKGHLKVSIGGESQVEMDLDDPAPSSRPKPSKKKLTKKDLRRRKPRNSITFPATRGKGALKPFSESNQRVRKRRYA